MAITVAAIENAAIRIVTIPLVREKASKPIEERKDTDIQSNGTLTRVRKVGLLSKARKGESV